MQLHMEMEEKVTEAEEDMENEREGMWSWGLKNTEYIEMEEEVTEGERWDKKWERRNVK